MFEVCLERRDGSSIEPFLMRDRASLQNLITDFLYNMLLHSRGSISFSLSKEILFVFAKHIHLKKHSPQKLIEAFTTTFLLWYKVLSQLTLPSLTVIEGLDLNPKSLCPLQARDLTVKPQKPSTLRRFW